MAYIVTVDEVLTSFQVFSVIHGTIWLSKRMLNNERHALIRKHHYSGHKGSAFACDNSDCAILS
jgi:hypothetical protein